MFTSVPFQRTCFSRYSLFLICTTKPAQQSVWCSVIFIIRILIISFYSFVSMMILSLLSTVTHSNDMICNSFVFLFDSVVKFFRFSSFFLSISWCVVVNLLIISPCARQDGKKVTCRKEHNDRIVWYNKYRQLLDDPTEAQKKKKRGTKNYNMIEVEARKHIVN